MVSTENSPSPVFTSPPALLLTSDITHLPPHPGLNTPELTALSKLNSLCTNYAPLEVQDGMQAAARWITGQSIESIADPVLTSNAPPVLTLDTTPTLTTYDVKLNRKTLLAKVHQWGLDQRVEYLETGDRVSIGHVFEMSSETWYNPLDIVPYSLGSPRGGTQQGDEVFCKLLVDSAGNKVPCREFHATCMYYIIILHRVRDS